MLDSLRKPLFIVALVLMVLVVLLELGSSLLPQGSISVAPAAIQNAVPGGDAVDPAEVQRLRQLHKAPPGLGIPYLALLDGLVLFTVLLMGASLLIPARVHGRIQGIATLLFSLAILIGSLLLIFAAIALLLLMVALLLAVPFGTIAYMAIYGSFKTGQASAVLGLIMTLKLFFAGSLVFAHQRFLENKGLVLIILTSLLATVIVSFLHGFVPGFLASITDAIGAIIVAVLALIWALTFFLGSIKSVIKVLRVDRAM